MDKLNECKSLMNRICGLPSKDDELKRIGFDEESIEKIRELILQFDFEADRQLARIKEIISKVEGEKTLFQGNPQS